MNLDALNYLVTQAPEQITQEAKGNLVCPDNALQIAQKLVDTKGDLQRLEPQQVEIYDRGIRPLIETVCCDGLYGDGSCVHDGLVDEQTLKACYIEEQFLCSHCRNAQKKLEQELKQAAARASRLW